MDTRKLVHFHTPRRATNRLGIDGQGVDTAVTIKQKGRAKHHITDATSMAREIASRWNAHPDLVARIAKLEAALGRAISAMKSSRANGGERLADGPGTLLHELQGTLKP